MPALRRSPPLRVLVLGPRAGLTRALKRLAVESVPWPASEPLPATRSAVVEAVRALPGPFTHVIAGTEAAVVPAAWARRALGARAAPFTISLRCHDKREMKRYLRERGIPMTPFLAGAPDLDPAAAVEALGLPVVVKARGRSGGRGITFADDEATLRALLARGRRREIMLERFVDAREASVESMIVGGAVRFASVTEYYVKGAVNVVPGGLSEPERADLLALNRRVIETLRITWGLTHMEVYRTEEGSLFGEIALRPPGGYIMEAISLAWGFDAWRAFACVELDEPFDFPDAPTRHAATWVIHPGPGRVASIEGADAVRALPGVERLRLKVEPGDTVGPREGLGNEIGHARFVADDREGLLRAVEAARAQLAVTLE